MAGLERNNMKLSKVNKNGSLSVILPKDYVKLNGWEEGQIVEIVAGTKNAMVIQQEVPLEEYPKQTVEEVLKELETTINSFQQFKKSTGDLNDTILKTFLKQQLLITIEKL